MGFYKTEAAQQFISSADSRETDKAIMMAIAKFAEDLADAKAIWRDGPVELHNELHAFFCACTNDGVIDPSTLQWGDGTLAEVMADL